MVLEFQEIIIQIQQILDSQIIIHFITAGGVETERSKLQIIRGSFDVGKKPVAFVTDTKFLYHITQQPQEQGTGLIQYITSSPKATGIIQSINITNKGVDYLKLPFGGRNLCS